MSGVEIRVRANTAQARRDLSRLEQSVKNLETSVSRTVTTFRNLSLGIGAAFAATRLVSGINRASDSVKNFENKIRLVVGETGKVNDTLELLYDISARSRTEIGGAVEVFNRFGLAIKNVDPGQLLNVTETIQKATVISGASAESARAALVQLGQGLASGELRGQELNSVREQIPRVAQAIADGIGVELGALKKLGEEGALTTQVVLDALLSQGVAVDEQFQLIGRTVGQVSAVFGNEFAAAIREIDKQVGFSDFIIDGIERVTSAVYVFRRTLDSNLDRISTKIFVFNTDAILGFFTLKNTIEDVFGIDIDGAFRSFLARLRSVRKEVTNLWLSLFYDIREQGPDKDAIFVPKNAFSFDQYLPSIESFKATLESFRDFIDDILYENVSTPGGNEKVRRSLSEALVFGYEKAVVSAKARIETAITSLKATISNLFDEPLYTSRGGAGGEEVELVPNPNSILFNFVSLFDSMRALSETGLGYVTDKFKAFWDALVTGFQYVLDTVIINSSFTDLIKGIIEKTDELMGDVPAKFENFKETIVGIFQELYDKVSPLITKLFYSEIDESGQGLTKRPFFAAFDNLGSKVRKEIDEVNKALQGSVLYNEEGNLKSFIELKVDLQASVKDAFKDLKTVTLDFLNFTAGEILLGSALLFKYGPAGFLLRIAGVTLAASQTAVEGVAPLIETLSRDVAAAIARKLEGDGSIFGNVGTALEAVGRGILPETGFETDSKFVNGLAGFLAVGVTLAFLSQSVRSAITNSSKLFAKAITTDYVAAVGSDTARLRMKNALRNTLRISILGAAIGLTGIVSGAIGAVFEGITESDLEQRPYWDFAITVMSFAGSYFVAGKLGNIVGTIATGVAGVISNAFLEIATNPAGRIAGVKLLARSVLTALAAAMTLPTAVLTVGLGIAAAVTGGFLYANNKVTQENYGAELAAGIATSFNDGFNAAFSSQLFDGAIGSLKEGLEGIANSDQLSAEELQKALVSSESFKDFTEIFNQNLIDEIKKNKRVLKKINFEDLFPGFIVDNEFIQNKIKEALDTGNLEEFDINDYINSETLKVDVQAEEVTGPIEAVQKTLSEQVDKIKAIDASVATEALANSLKKITEVEIITDSQVEGIDKMSGSLETLGDNLKRYVDLLKEIPQDAKDSMFGFINSKTQSSVDPRGFASGGFISGPGSGTSDSIIARVSNGEYIIKQSSVSKYGTDFLNAINNGNFPKYASGGLIGSLLPGFNKGKLVETKDTYTPEEIGRYIRDGILDGINADNFFIQQSIISDLQPTIEKLEDALELDPQSTVLMQRLAEAQDRLTTALGKQDNAVTSAINQFNILNGTNIPTKASRGTGGTGGVSVADQVGFGYAEDFFRTFKQGLNNALITGDFKSFGELLLDRITMSVIDSFTSGFTEALLGGIVGDKDAPGPLADFFGKIFDFGQDITGKTAESLAESTEDGAKKIETGGVFSKVKEGFGNMFNSIFGNEGLFGSLFNLAGNLFGSFLGIPKVGAVTMNSGGIVPSTPYSQVGKDSVPALLTPGELVVPADKVNSFMKDSNKSNQTVVNLSITGDVSRQTRQEIVKMLPTIASGVNAQNKERNYKYR